MEHEQTTEEALKEKLAAAPDAPGVYLMKDEEGRIIYVGKARSLRKRLASYFKPNGHPDMKTGILIRRIADFETIITGTENEALILESNLIKKHRPRYNVILKDDKRYPSLRLDPKAPFPTLKVVRKPSKDGALYFGPFSSPGAVYETLKMINKTYRLRKCKSPLPPKRDRPCINYQMGTCLGACVRDVDEEAYKKMVQEVILLLKGRAPELLKRIEGQMYKAAAVQDFESAAALRDRIAAIKKTQEKQVSVTADFMDRDLFAICRMSGYALITVMDVRSGSLLGSRHYRFEEVLENDAEMIRTFLRQYYEKIPFVPKEILVSHMPEDVELLEADLRNRRGGAVNINHPVRGEKAKLLEMARQNGAGELKKQVEAIFSETEMLTRLKNRLRLSVLPHRIECFDNSNISGSEPVSAMVVFDHGKPDKSAYRKFKIRSVSQVSDDYAFMAEALKRRYGKGEKSDPFPDLLMVDGGKGQLNIALSVVRELGIGGAFEIIGIAKKDEKKGESADKIFKPGQSNPVPLGREGDLLFFLQRIRDEAHRFAISFHRKRRNTASLRSALDVIPGIGKKRKAALLRHFKTVDKIREATAEEIREVPGMTRAAADAVKHHLDLSPE